MAWDPNPTVILSTYAAAVQLLVALALLMGNPRNERVAVLGALFLLNGFVAALHAYLTGTAEPFVSEGTASVARRTSAVVALTTNVLILWFALLYPRRARFLPKRGLWIIAPVGSLALVFAMHALLPNGLASIRGHTDLDFKDALFGFVLFELAFPVLLIRWSLQWTQDMPTAQRKQFLLLYAAFVVRALHVVPFFLVKFIQWPIVGATTWTVGATIVFIPVLGAMAVGVVAPFVIMLRRPPRRVEHRWMHNVALGALGLGTVLAVANLVINFGPNYQFVWFGIWSQIDVLVLRPILVWFAVVRFGFSNKTFRSLEVGWGFAAVTFGAFASVAFLTSMQSVTSPTARILLSCVLGLVAGLGITLLVRHVVRRQLQDGETPRDLTHYAALVEEAQRMGPLTVGNRLRLAHARDTLHVSRQHHDAIVAGLANRDTPVSDWAVGAIVMERYELDEALGPSTWIAKDVLSSEHVSLQLTRRDHDASLYETLRAMTLVRHPTIVPMRRLEWYDDHLVMVTPFIEAPRLEDQIVGHALTLNRTKAVAHDIKTALKATHRAGLIHGNVTPQSILCNLDGTYVLTDFAMPGAQHAQPRFKPASAADGWSADSDKLALTLVLLDCLGRHPVVRGLPDNLMAAEMAKLDDEAIRHALPEELRGTLG